MILNSKGKEFGKVPNLNKSATKKVYMVTIQCLNI